MTLDRPAPRAILLAFLVTLAGLAQADHYTDDAGSGADAGGTKETAMPIGFGSHLGYLGPRDWDWYRVDTAAAPRCVQLDASGDNNDTVRLALAGPDGSRYVAGQYPAGGATRLALAAPAVTTTWFDVTASPNEPLKGDPARPGHYAFTLGAIGIPAPSMGDALTGADAGNSLGSATPAPGSCIGGRIAPLRQMGDTRDVYAIVVPEGGGSVTYSFATAAAPGVLSLALLDAEGDAVGPGISSGDVATATGLSAGTYYLSAVRVSVGTDDVGYLIGVVFGPPDQNGCRPYC